MEPVPSPQPSGLVPRSPQWPLPRFCSSCGLSLSQLRETSRVGCEVCYHAFADLLQDSLRRLQGTTEHGLAPPDRTAAPLERAQPHGRETLQSPDWIEQLLGPDRLAWLAEDGPQVDVVLSSRLRLARNLQGTAFPALASPQALGQVRQRLTEVLTEQPGWLALPLEQLSSDRVTLLQERHLLSGPWHSEQGLVCALEGRSSAVLHDEDHLRWQTLRSGWCLTPAWDELRTLAAELEHRLPMARHPRLGYLTSCPSNLGTGLRASLLLHLPALTWCGALPEVARKVAAAGGLILRGLHGEHSPLPSPFLQLSNQVTLGRSEDDLIRRVENLAHTLVSWERQARERLWSRQRLELEDAVWRAWGALAHARRISPEEALGGLSLLRLGELLGLLPRLPVRPLRLLIQLGDGHLQQPWPEAAPRGRLEERRATVLRRALQ